MLKIKKVTQVGLRFMILRVENLNFKGLKGRVGSKSKMAGLPTSPPSVFDNTALLRDSNLKESPQCLGSKNIKTLL